MPTRGESPELASTAQPDEVGQLVRRGAKWSVARIAGRNLLSLGATAILARLLSPDDYGLVAMVATLTALLQVFSEMGLGWATIQRKGLTLLQVSNLFWINAAVGAGFWLACVLQAPYLADFYGREELEDIAQALGITFLLSGLAAQPMALINRQMNIRQIALIELSAILISSCVAIICAFSGLGYWSLVVKAISEHLLRVLFAFPASKLTVRLPVFGVGTRSLVSFGGYLVVTGILLYVARNLDNVLIGRQWGSEELGYYGRAYFLMLLPTSLAAGALSSLMIPALSSFQDDAQRLSKAYRRAARLVALVGCPLAVGLGLTATEVVPLVYGDGWEPVIPILIWLCLAGVTQPIYGSATWLFTATGHARAYLLMSFVHAVVLGITFLWAVRLGVVELAAAYGVVMSGLLFLPSLYMAHRVAGLKLNRTLRDLVPIAVSLLVMAFVVLTAASFCRAFDQTMLFNFIVKVVSGLLAYGFMVRLLMPRALNDDLLTLLPPVLTARLQRLLRIA